VFSRLNFGGGLNCNSAKSQAESMGSRQQIFFSDSIDRLAAVAFYEDPFEFLPDFVRLHHRAANTSFSLASADSAN